MEYFSRFVHLMTFKLCQYSLTFTMHNFNFSYWPLRTLFVKKIELGEFILLSCLIKFNFLHFSKLDKLTIMMSNIFASWTTL